MLFRNNFLGQQQQEPVIPKRSQVESHLQKSIIE